VFRIIKALLQLGYGNKKLQWTVITGKTQRVLEGDRTQPAHAGVSGLVGSLAKEYPQWDVRLLDLESLAAVSARECLSLPWDKAGNGLGHRKGEWFQPGLARLGSTPDGTARYRQNGVYVVIGGAGGLGEVWSRYMMERYQANVVWIGRRVHDAALEEKMTESLIRLGCAPVYISADARKLEQLEQARATILKTYPAIHGVVHSALVLQDQSVARMDESGFRASLAAKVDISVNMDRVFGQYELDFMLFFSSLVSFLKPAGQSNYAAGCSFKDSFAHKLEQERAYPVKIMNWGYWGHVGVAADEFHRKAMEQMGMGSIEPEEGMASLQALMSSDAPQVALIKTLKGNAPLWLAEALWNRNTALTSISRTVHESRPAAARTEQMTNEHIRQVVTDKLSEALKIDTAMIPTDTPFTEFGVDSIIGVNLIRKICETLQIELDPTKLFEYSTVDALSRYIWTHCQKQTTPLPIQVESTSREAGSSRNEEPEPRTETSSQLPESAGAPVPEMNDHEILETVSWQKVSLDDGYEKVTF
jgi:acyl carrier protein/short-subunit dehydrogenase